MKQGIVQTVTTPSASQYLRVRIEQIEYRFQLLHAAVDHRLEHTGASKRSREHSHAGYHVILFTAGENAFRFKGYRYTCRRGTLLLCSPGNPHSFAPLLHGASQYSEITFMLISEQGKPLLLPFSQVLSAYTGLHLSPKSFPLQLQEFETVELESLLNHYLNWLATPGPLSNINAEQRVIQIFNYLVQTCFLLHDRSASISEKLLHTRQYIEANYTRKLRVDELAGLAGMSKGHFFRLFKKSFGLSPVAFQRRKKIDAAIVLLRTSNLQIGEIAVRVGFDNTFYFSKTFKKLTGGTPSRYRQR